MATLKFSKGRRALFRGRVGGLFSMYINKSEWFNQQGVVLGTTLMIGEGIKQIPKVFA